MYEAGGFVYYSHADWLGSSRLASTASRTIYYDGAYGPFGEPYAQSGTTDLNFTGMNQDTAANVYDFPMREYGIQGRWPSPDPAGLAAVDPTDPQTWNRYTYVRNSPLELIDPLGLCGDNHPCPPPSAGDPVNCTIDGTPAPCGMAEGLVSSGGGIDVSALDLWGGIGLSPTAAQIEQMLSDPTNPPLIFQNGVVYTEDEDGNLIPVGDYYESSSCDGPCISGFAQQALGQAGTLASTELKGSIAIIGTVDTSYIGGVLSPQILNATSVGIDWLNTARVTLQYNPEFIMNATDFLDSWDPVFSMPHSVGAKIGWVVSQFIGP